MTLTGLLVEEKPLQKFNEALWENSVYRDVREILTFRVWNLWVMPRPSHPLFHPFLSPQLHSFLDLDYSVLCGFRERSFLTSLGRGGGRGRVNRLAFFMNISVIVDLPKCIRANICTWKLEERLSWHCPSTKCWSGYLRKLKDCILSPIFSQKVVQKVSSS